MNLERYSTSIEEKIVLTLVKTVRKTLFRAAAIGRLQKGREIVLNSEYSKDSWGLLAKEGA